MPQIRSRGPSFADGTMGGGYGNSMGGSMGGGYGNSMGSTGGSGGYMSGGSMPGGRTMGASMGGTGYGTQYYATAGGATVGGAAGRGVGAATAGAATGYAATSGGYGAQGGFRDDSYDNVAFRGNLVAAAPGKSGASANQYKVMFDYEASGDDELSLKEGEIITVTNKDESGWWEGTNSQGESGLFPGNYVEKA